MWRFMPNVTGPTWTPIRFENTGSVKIFNPYQWMSTVEWPTQVALTIVSSNEARSGLDAGTLKTGRGSLRFNRVYKNVPTLAKTALGTSRLRNRIIITSSSKMV